MRTLVAALIAFAPALSGAAPYPYAYERVKVAEGIHAFIDTPGHAVVSGTTVVVVGDDAAAVIDTGHHPRLTRRIIEEIRALTPKPVAFVVNTHWHNDHVSGNGLYVEAFPGAKVVTHAFTSTLLERDVRAFQGPNCAPFLRAQSKGLREMLAAGVGGDGAPLTEARRKRMQGFLDDADAAIEECAEFRFRGADVTFTDRMTLRLGGREVELIHLGRANTAGDIVAWIPDAKVLAAGDLVVHPFPFATQSYISEWAAVLRKLEAMPFEAMVPGHGPVMRDRKYLRDVAETLESIMAQARSAYRPGMTADELRKHVDLRPFRDRIAGSDAFIGANFDYMLGQLAVKRAWEELRGSFEPEALALP